MIQDAPKVPVTMPVLAPWVAMSLSEAIGDCSRWTVRYVICSEHGPGGAAVVTSAPRLPQSILPCRRLYGERLAV